MSFVHAKYAWNISIESTPKLVLLALCKFANEEGHCYPSIATIARMAGISERHCQRVMRGLAAQSFVAVVGNAHGGARSRDYRLNLPALSRAAAESKDRMSPVATVTPVRVTPARTAPDKDVTRTTKRKHQSETPTLAHEAAALDWSCLPQLMPADKVVVVDVLRGITAECRQDLVDELAGALQANVIRGHWQGWLRAVAKRAKDGTFVANHAIAVQQARQRRAREEAEAEQRRAEAARCKSPAQRERNIAAMKAVIAELSRSSRAAVTPSGLDPST